MLKLRLLMEIFARESYNFIIANILRSTPPKTCVAGQEKEHFENEFKMLKKPYKTKKNEQSEDCSFLVRV